MGRLCQSVDFGDFRAGLVSALKLEDEVRRPAGAVASCFESVDLLLFPSVDQDVGNIVWHPHGSHHALVADAQVMALAQIAPQASHPGS
eukprot:3089584-Prymnesium_polylepis.2